MKRLAWIRKSGPFRCISQANGYILLKPSWSQYGHVWNQKEGGGPGFLGRMSLAADLEKWLNSIYSEIELNDGFNRIELHDAELKKEKNNASGHSAKPGLEPHSGH